VRGEGQKGAPQTNPTPNISEQRRDNLINGGRGGKKSTAREERAVSQTERESSGRQHYMENTLTVS